MCLWRPGAGEPLGGQPSKEARASSKDLDYQLHFEATLWAIPAAAVCRFRGGALDAIWGPEVCVRVPRHAGSGPGDLQGVVHSNPRYLVDFRLGVPEQQRYSAQVFGAATNQRRLGPPSRGRAATTGLDTLARVSCLWPRQRNASCMHSTPAVE